MRSSLQVFFSIIPRISKACAFVVYKCGIVYATDAVSNGFLDCAIDFVVEISYVRFGFVHDLCSVSIFHVGIAHGENGEENHSKVIEAGIYEENVRLEGSLSTPLEKNIGRVKR